MKYNVFQEVYEPRGVYPIATQRSELFTSSDPAEARKARNKFGMMQHSQQMTNGKRQWKYERRSSQYIHLTTITEV